MSMNHSLITAISCLLGSLLELKSELPQYQCHFILSHSHIFTDSVLLAIAVFSCVEPQGCSLDWWRSFLLELPGMLPRPGTDSSVQNRCVCGVCMSCRRNGTQLIQRDSLVTVASQEFHSRCALLLPF